MARTAFSTVPMKLKEDIENMDVDKLNESFDAFVKGNIANNSESQFLRKIKTMCASMGHTGAAAKRARSRTFALMFKFGLPAVMFTVNPRDDNLCC